MLFFSSRVAYISNLMIILLYIDGTSGLHGKPEGPQCVIYSLTCIYIYVGKVTLMYNNLYVRDHKPKKY